MSFPAGWTPGPRGTHFRDIEPVNTAVTYALMSLPAATIIKYAVVDQINYTEPVTRITYDPAAQEAVLS